MEILQYIRFHIKNSIMQISHYYDDCEVSMWLRRSMFRARPFHFFKSVLLTFQISFSHFSVSVLLIFLSLTSPFFRINASHIFKSVILIFRIRLFLNQSFPVFRVSPSYFWGVSASHFSQLVLPFFGDQILSYFPVRLSHFLSHFFAFFEPGLPILFSKLLFN